MAEQAQQPPVHAPAQADDRPLRSDELLLPFDEAHKPETEFRIGIEAERFGIRVGTLQPLQYDGKLGILELFHGFVTRFGWVPSSEHAGGPTISLHRGDAAITLEPAGQFEFSGSPLSNVHAVEDERLRYVHELEALSQDAGLQWIGSGFHPLATHDQLPWVPKLRYGIMRSYLASRGGEALEMMRRTATVQANFDYANEEDGLRKLRVGLRLSPIVSAMFANAPLVEGRWFEGRSRRMQVWLNVDPDRQGLLPQMWNERSTLLDYVGWALDAPMFMFVRNASVVSNTGQTFRAFLEDGFEGYRPTMSDWKTHLNTLFPEVRIKSTIEVRGADSVPSRYVPALPALWTGVFYDAVALDEAERLTADWTYEEMVPLRGRLALEGLQAEFRGKRVAHIAESVMRIAHDGLSRRGRLDAGGRNESVHLDALAALTSRGMTPADEVIEQLGSGTAPSTSAILSVTQA